MLRLNYLTALRLIRRVPRSEPLFPSGSKKLFVRGNKTHIGSFHQIASDDRASQLYRIQSAEVMTLHHDIGCFQNWWKYRLLNHASHIAIKCVDGHRDLLTGELLLLTKPAYRGTCFDLRKRRDNLRSVIFGACKSNHVLTALLLNEELRERTCIDEVEDLEPPPVTQDNLRG
jgi:hypothetical protein